LRVSVTVIGAGVAGLTCALALAEHGAAVEVVDRGSALGDRSCSWQAGGMLAPWCERATAEPVVATLGAPSIAWWAERYPGTVRNGSLIVAQTRDMADLTRFAQRTERFEWIGAERIAQLEPDLAGRFQKALYFADEAHLDPRRALACLAETLAQRGVAIRYGVDLLPSAAGGGIVVDCRGFAARDALPDLRGVRGEMLVVRSRDLKFARPVRMLHPRIPLYIVPRGEGVFMIGATMIESEEHGRVSVRSTMELLSAAFALNPAFGEAEILEMKADVRPAFPDNLPRIVRNGNIFRVNGLYRHGFLLAPALAREVAEAVFEPKSNMETKDADFPERRCA
jgi:glycine oxidase